MELINKQLAEPHSEPQDYTPNVLQYDDNRIKLLVRVNRSGYLLFGEGYSRHWRVYVNSKEQKIVTANVNFMAVAVDKNTQTVEFVFRPTVYSLSALISIVVQCITLLILVCSSTASRIRGRKVPDQRIEGEMIAAKETLKTFTK